MLNVLTETVQWRRGSREGTWGRSLREVVQDEVEKWVEQDVQVQMWKLPKDVRTLAKEEAMAAALSATHGLKVVQATGRRQQISTDGFSSST